MSNHTQELQETIAQPQHTFGQNLVRVGLHHKQDHIVTKIKMKTAELIDLLEVVKKDSAAQTYVTTDAEMNVHIDTVRLTHEAQKQYEQACMWAVKAVTK